MANSNMLLNNDKAMRQALIDNLSVILSPTDTDRRLECEERIRMLQVTETFALDMIEISHDNNLDFALRQLALVILKQYVAAHWKMISANFTPPETLNHIKEHVRNTLIRTLGSPGSYTTPQQKVGESNTSENDTCIDNKDKRLRTCMAAVITNIAVFDWPEEWPNLLEILTTYLCSSDRLVIYGAMKVFVELSRDITEQQIPHIIPIILPKMYDIFIQPSLYPIGTRCRALRIFSNLCESFQFIYDSDKSSGAKARKNYLEPILPKVIEALIKGLQMPTNMTDDVGRTYVVVNLEIKYEIMNCLFILMEVAKKIMLKWLDHLLPVIWNILTETASLYLTSVVNSDTNTDPDTSGNDLDLGEEEEETALCRLVRSIISFVQQLVESSKLRKKYIKGNITDVMYYLINYMLITDEQMHLWKEDPDQFIIDEEEDSFSNSIRNVTFELISTFSDEFCEESDQENSPAKSQPDSLWFWLSIMDAIKRHFNELAQHQSDLSESACTKRWKLQETCLMALGHGPESFISIIKSSTSEAQSLSSDLMVILKTVLQNSSDDYPFLVGRVLITSSKFAAIMHDDEVKRFLQATYNGLCNDSDVIKICAIRSTQAFCQYLNSSDRIHLMRPIMLAVLNRLVQIGMNYSVDVLSVVFDAILTMITADREFAPAAESEVAPLIISSLLKNGQSPCILLVIEEILDQLFRVKACYVPLHDRLIPTLLDILTREHQKNTKNGVTSLATLQPAALDILRTMIVESPLPISDSMMTQIFPSAINCVLSTQDDSAIIQSGGELIRGFVSKSVDQVAAYRFPGTDQNGISGVLRVCLHILDPKTNENCAMFISRLVSVFIRKACHYISEDNKQLLLRSVLTKLLSADTLVIVQSILLIFAHLINFDYKAIIDFLSQLPAPSGNQSAFEFVIVQWLSRQQLFYGRYDQRVTLFALCSLMENSFQLLNATMVPDDGTTNENQDGSQSAITRSKSKQNQANWTVIPASVKIIKILLHEYWEALHLDNGSSGDSSVCSTLDADEDDDEEWKDVEHDDSHNSNEVDISDTADGDFKLRSMQCSRTSRFDDCGNSNNTKSDNHVISESARDDEDLLKCVSYNYTDSDDVDVINDPINCINLKETLFDFLKRFKNSPYVASFLPHLNENEKSILDDIAA